MSFFASSGDYASFSGLAYPAASPEVVSVGATTLNLSSAGQWRSETGWSSSGGGYSQAFTEPSYQDGVQNSGMRSNPDVAADGDPSTGVAVYDPYDFGTATPWDDLGGTSLSAQLWAGMMSIADQGRVLAGGQPLGATQVLTDLYGLPSSDFHDITVGNNGFPAGPGYDLVTGLGSPQANLLIPQLAADGLASRAAIVIQPPTSMPAGASFGIVAAAADSVGDADPSFDGTATLTLVSGPAGAKFTPVTAPVTNGTVVFQGLSLSKIGSGYKLQVTINGLASANTNTVTVTAARPGVGYFYPLPVDNGLAAAVASADSNNDSTNIITLYVTSITYPVSSEVLIDNTSNLHSKSLTFVGQGATTSVIDASGASRVFEIVGAGSSLSVVLQNLTIEGGLATDNGGLNLPNTALGGGLLIDGGNVALSNVAVLDNAASGAAGAAGAPGAYATSANPTGGPGGNGGNGGNARGGGIYLAAGNLSLNSVVLEGNSAVGGAGGAGGQGGDGISFSSFGGFGAFRSGNAGPGGAGGAGGSAAGGGLYVAGGSLAPLNGTVVMSGNAARGGAGGSGGGSGGFIGVGGHGASGGNGGAGGNAAGGAAFLNAADAVFNGVPNITGNTAAAGGGGAGARGGEGGGGLLHYSAAQPGQVGLPGGNGGAGGNGGNGGQGGWGRGGGIYVTGGGSLTFDKGGTVADDRALGGAGGDGGLGGLAGPGGGGGQGGSGAAGAPGGGAGARARLVGRAAMAVRGGAVVTAVTQAAGLAAACT